MNWGYIGGLIDSDGSFFRNDSLRRISIYNTNFNALEKIKNFLGYGSIVIQKKHKGHFGNKPMYILYIVKKTIKNPRNGLILGKEISPYIFVKTIPFESTFYPLKASMFKIDWDYLGGFFDGDGFLTFKENDGATHCHLGFVNNYKEIILKIKNFLKCGYIYEHGNGFMFRIGKREDFITTGVKLSQHCIIKRSKLLDMLRFYEKDEYHPNYIYKDVNPSELYSLYVEKKLSIRKIAKIYGVMYGSMYRKLREVDIPIRTPSEATLNYNKHFKNKEGLA